MSNDYADWIERHFVEYQRDSKNLRGKNYILTDIDKQTLIDLNFENMTAKKPDNGKLIRLWQPGLDAQYRTSTNMMSLKCKIFKLQVIILIIPRSKFNFLM